MLSSLLRNSAILLISAVIAAGIMAANFIMGLAVTVLGILSIVAVAFVVLTSGIFLTFKSITIRRKPKPK